ncbi:type II toxin-antitoxin system RelE/ParE family toxin [Halomonas malpeensis]|uniref:Type II toxin-antitoxin system RelE/ParE family toxin n=1 Tax=Vreelandella malpeensis TaxID=1172368 RepID=A0ABS8DPS8_9GAMM|nr:type II toxin-antitoxin system RelE/ParE family toxin [Halomonas malpeensis]MCB8888299.1 type II toxin-antitoxin system RelE/ParE family toxin [Halomonas malpeensis]
MIRSIKHKGLAEFFKSGSTAGIQAAHPKRLWLQELSGHRSGIWSVTVSGNWRMTFRFEDGDAEIVNYEDCH